MAAVEALEDAADERAAAEGMAAWEADGWATVPYAEVKRRLRFATPTPPEPGLVSACSAVLTRYARKAVRRLDRPVPKRVDAVLDCLAADPRPAGVKALTGHPGLLRVRVGLVTRLLPA